MREIPMEKLVMLSQGMFSEEALQGILDTLNGDDEDDDADDN
jgi:hypothetical protein